MRDSVGRVLRLSVLACVLSVVFVVCVEAGWIGAANVVGPAALLAWIMVAGGVVFIAVGL